jgi:hypothetical protein
MSVDVRSSWILKAEEAIRALRDVESVSIQGDEDSIREIHVLSRSNRAPKLIVRDIQTVLLTRFNRAIDYRVVSVAYLGDSMTVPAATQPVLPLPPAMTAPPAVSAPAGAVAPVAAGAATPAPAPAAPDAERIRFGSVNLFVSGPRTQAQVELRWRGLPRLGSASGWSTRAGAHRLIAQATVSAVREFLAEDVALSAQDVEFLRLGRNRLAVVSLSLLVGRQEKLLVGTCVVEQDVPQAVVCATLAALNRVVTGLRPLESTEYVVRPAPGQ